MKAIICKKFAPVSDLVWEEVADPIAGPGEIVVDVKAARKRLGANEALASLVVAFAFFHQFLVA